MTGRWGSEWLYVRARLTVNCGQLVNGTWLRYPTADYRCYLCGHRAEASGDQVTEFVRTAATQHEATCPNRGEVAR